MLSKFFHKFINFLEKLSSKPKIDGLEISSGVLKYVFERNGEIKTAFVKLPPKVIENGRLKQKDEFITALKNLKKIVEPQKEDSLLKINVLIPPSLVFTQTVTIPESTPDRLEETINLNLQMLSPLPFGEANMSAQILTHNDLNYELFAAIAPQKEIALYEEALNEAGFIPICFEFSSVALARFFKKYFVVPAGLFITIVVSSEGFEIFVLRDGKVIFDYFKSWQNIQENKSISREYLKALTIEEIRQVLNFVSSKFGINVSGLMFLAPGLEDLITEVALSHFNIKAIPIVVPQLKIPGSFYPALGAFLRFQSDEENLPFQGINLGGSSLQKSIYRQQVISFIVLWRWILTAVFAFLLFAFILGDIFVANQYKNFNQSVLNFKPPLDIAKLNELIAKAQSFNANLEAIKNVKSSSKDYAGRLKHLYDLIDSNHIILKSISISSFSSPVSIIGNAPSYEKILKFKDILSNDPIFTDVDLPLTQITIQTDNSVNFSLVFSFK